MDNNLVITVCAAIAAIVTAVATIMLWRVTGVLAKETQRVADAVMQPQIVATIRPNQWTMMYANLVVANTGNAAAFDITVVFDPPLQLEPADEGDRAIPLQTISILRPGESLSSDIGRGFPMLDQVYQVTTSWLRNPTSLQREALTYTTTYGDLRGVAQLGTSDPLVQIAQEVKHIRDDWRSMANGNRKLQADVFTAVDRLRERRAWQRHRRALMQASSSAGLSADDATEA